MFVSYQVHKETITAVHNSIQGRSDVEIEIYGMEGIPEKDVEEHAKKIREQTGPKNKKQKREADSDDDDEDDDEDDNNLFANQMQFAGMPHMAMPGMMPHGPMPGMMGMGLRMPGQMPPHMNWGPTMMGHMQMGPRGPMRPNTMLPNMHPNAGHMMPPGMVSRPTMNIPKNEAPNGGAPKPTELSDTTSTPRPLFPAASNVQPGKMPPAASGDSLSAKIVAPKTISSHSQLMHPGDENLSIEEIRRNALQSSQHLTY